jgi:hypothetical protein
VESTIDFCVGADARNARSSVHSSAGKVYNFDRVCRRRRFRLHRGFPCAPNPRGSVHFNQAPVIRHHSRVCLGAYHRTGFPLTKGSLDTRIREGFWGVKVLKVPLCCFAKLLAKETRLLEACARETHPSSGGIASYFLLPGKQALGRRVSRTKSC